MIFLGHTFFCGSTILFYTVKEKKWIILCIASFTFKFTEHISGQCDGNIASGLLASMLVFLLDFLWKPHRKIIWKTHSYYVVVKNDFFFFDSKTIIAIVSIERVDHLPLPHSECAVSDSGHSGNNGRQVAGCHALCDRSSDQALVVCNTSQPVAENRNGMIESSDTT